MRVLVTGGAGYIGSHTAKAFAHGGIPAIVLDNLSRGHRHAVRWSTFVHADVGDREALDRIFKTYSIDAVIHFAAFAYVGESMRHPGIYFDNNVAKTITLLEAMRENGVKKIIFSSSCATYGTPKQPQITEKHAQEPINPYGESKLMGERLLRWYGEAIGLKWVSLRYFNAAGADPNGDLGEEHNPETHLIPLVISSALGEIPFVEIYGTDYETPDGTAIRDYVHVADLANAHLAAFRYLEAGGQSVALNLGTGNGHSIGAVISAVEQVTGANVRLRESPRRSGDPASLVADSMKASRELGWRPHCSSLDEIVRTAWNWKVKAAHCNQSSGGRADTSLLKRSAAVGGFIAS